MSSSSSSMVVVLLDAIRERYAERDLAPRSSIIRALETCAARGLTLQYLELNGNSTEMFDARINDLEVFALFEALSEGRNMFTRIDLSFNLLEDAGAIAIAAWIRTDRRIHSLNLSGNSIGEDGAVAIAQALETSSLRVLSMFGNPIGDRGGIMFAEILRTNEILEELNIGNCDIQTSSLVHFADMLRRNNRVLRALDISNPLLFSKQEETTLYVCKALEENDSLLYISLAHHGIHTAGAEWLAEMFLINSTLESVNLSGNLLTMEGIEALCARLCKNSCIRFLDISFNRLDHDGAVALSKLLSISTSLVELNIHSCKIPDSGLVFIGNAILSRLSKTPTLQRLSIWENGFEHKSSSVFRKIEAAHDAPRMDVKTYQVDETVYVAKCD